MSALSYLVLKTIKNRIISLRKKPGMLILYSIVALSIVFICVMSFFLEAPQGISYKDPRIIYLIISVLGLFFVYSFVAAGLSTGSTLFTMADVGLLFVSPISSKKILIYGLVKEMAKTLLGAIFILYQITTLRTNFGFGFSEILALFFVYVIMVFFCQLVSMAVYILTNGSEKRKKIIKSLSFLIFGLIALWYLLIKSNQNLGAFDAAMTLIDSPWFGAVPIAGWTTMFFKAIVEGNLFFLILSIGLYLIGSVVIISLFTAGTADCYEDVLLSTEVRHQQLMAVKEGRRVTQKKKVKIKDKVEAFKNSGVKAIYDKQLLEMKRKSRFAYVDNYTLIATVGAAIAGYYTKEQQFGGMIVLAFFIYILFFVVSASNMNTELTKHFIFLIPGTSRRKIFYASATTLLKPCIDGFCIFAAVGIFGGEPPINCLAYALAYASSGAVFVAMNILFHRVLGGIPSKLVQALVGIGLFGLIMAPAVIVMIVSMLFLPKEFLFLSTLPYTLTCIGLTAVLYATCGNIIDKIEFTGKL